MIHSAVLFFPQSMKLETENGAEYENGQASLLDHTSQPSIIGERCEGSIKGRTDLFGPLNVANFTTVRKWEWLFVNA
jgi:hypothetical protein